MSESSQAKLGESTTTDKNVLHAEIGTNDMNKGVYTITVFCVSIVFHLKGAVSLAKEQEMRHNIERYQSYLRGSLRKHCDRTV